MATRSMDSQDEFLGKIQQLIAQAKMARDADLSFWIGLETQVIQKANEPPPSSQQLPPPPGNAMEMGAPPDMGPMPAMGGMGGGGVAAGLPGPGGPMPTAPGPRFSPDVMRQALRGGGIQGG